MFRLLDVIPSFEDETNLQASAANLLRDAPGTGAASNRGIKKGFVLTRLGLDYQPCRKPEFFWSHRDTMRRCIFRSFPGSPENRACG
jgi:hypothetical protein